MTCEKPSAARRSNAARRSDRQANGSVSGAADAFALAAFAPRSRSAPRASSAAACRSRSPSRSRPAPRGEHEHEHAGAGAPDDPRPLRVSCTPSELSRALSAPKRRRRSRVRACEPRRASPPRRRARHTTRASTSRRRRPSGGQGVWIRHTVHKRPGEEPPPRSWFTLFDADAPGPRATKATFAAAELSAPDGAYIRGRRRGARARPRHRRAQTTRARGELGPRPSTIPAPAFHHLPYEWLYEAPLPRTKLPQPLPERALQGTVTDRRRADRARRLAGDDRSQLGRRARRALGLDPGRRPGRESGEATSTSPRAGSRSGR